MKDASPRLVLYHQTIHEGDRYVPLKPLLDYGAGVTHLMIAAIHLNGAQARYPITINDHPPADIRFRPLWADCKVLQRHGVKVMCMLGGAAKGSFTLLDQDEEIFESHYALLRNLIRACAFDGIDLDVEERMSLQGIMRLIDRLKTDFGQDFIISLAPVATAMHGGHNLSKFDYRALEVSCQIGRLQKKRFTDSGRRGHCIAFYNVQFYCGHGSLLDTKTYEKILQAGWHPQKLVVGCLTSWKNGPDWVPIVILKKTWNEMRVLADGVSPNLNGDPFGGVMGWEYFNSLPGGASDPYMWCCTVSRLLGISIDAK